MLGFNTSFLNRKESIPFPTSPPKNTRFEIARQLDRGATVEGLARDPTDGGMPRGNAELVEHSVGIEEIRFGRLEMPDDRADLILRYLVHSSVFPVISVGLKANPQHQANSRTLVPLVASVGPVLKILTRLCQATKQN